MCELEISMKPLQLTESNLLVNLHRWEEVVNKVEWHQQPDSAGRQHDSERHDERIPKVEESWYGTAQAPEIKYQVVDGV